MSVHGKSYVYLGLAFGLSWLVVAVGWFLGGATSPTIAVLTMAVMMLGPSLAAIVCATVFEKGRRREALGLWFKPNIWWFWAWVIAIAIAVGSSAITIASGHAEYLDPGQNYLTQLRATAPDVAAQLEALPVTWILIAQAAVLNALLSTPLLLISEELGWRGYLYDLWRRFGFLRYTLATGMLWGLWHAPAIYLFGLNYPENRVIGIPMFVVFCILFSFPHTLVRDRGKSVVAAAILHATSNAVGGTAMLALTQAAFPWSGVVGVGGFVMLTIVAVVCWTVSVAAKTPADVATTD
ncbi:MAG: CPBP family intramembrane glutamic endopeptidase [Terricaulis sp.]